MTKIILGLLLGFLIGAGCRWLDIPVPSPPSLVGALLVVAMTLGYAATDRYLSAQSHSPSLSPTNPSPSSESCWMFVPPRAR